METRGARRTGRKAWLVSWLIFSLLGGLWSLASPVLSVPDEPAHAVYSAAAVRGQIWEPIGDNGLTTVVLPDRWDVAQAVIDCYIFDPRKPAGCANAFAGGEGEVEVDTSAGHYPPAYYMYAGLGSLVADGAKAVYAMRLLTAMLVAAFLASAVCSILARPRPALGLVGLGLATTPMLFFFAGAVNPQAPEIAAAILLWVSGVGLLKSMRSDDDVPLNLRTADLRRVLVAVAALPLCRPLSLLWLALIVGILLVAFASLHALRRLLASPAVWAALPVIVLTVGSNLFWFFVRPSLSEGTNTSNADVHVTHALRFSMAKLDDEYREMIGVFGWLTTPAPGLVYVVFTMLLGALVALAALHSPVRQNIAVALTVAAVVVVPVALEVTSYQTAAFPWQGRYTLPMAVGVPLLLALGDGADRLAGSVARRFLVVTAAGLVAVHGLSYMGALNRHVFGIDGIWGISSPGWAPPLSYSPLMFLAGAVILAGAVLACRAARPARGPLPGPRVDEEPRLPLQQTLINRQVIQEEPVGVH